MIGLKIAQGTSNIQGALTQLQGTSQSLLGTVTLIFVILGPILAIGGSFLFKTQKEKNGFYWVGFAAAIIGVMMIIGGVLGIVMYLLTPLLVQKIMYG